MLGSDVWDASIHLQDHIGNHGVFGSDVWDASIHLQDYSGNNEVSLTVLIEPPYSKSLIN